MNNNTEMTVLTWLERMTFQEPQYQQIFSIPPWEYVVAKVGTEIIAAPVLHYENESVLCASLLAGDPQILFTVPANYVYLIENCTVVAPDVFYKNQSIDLQTFLTTFIGLVNSLSDNHLNFSDWLHEHNELQLLKNILRNYYVNMKTLLIFHGITDEAEQKVQLRLILETVLKPYVGDIYTFVQILEQVMDKNSETKSEPIGDDLDLSVWGDVLQ